MPGKNSERLTVPPLLDFPGVRMAGCIDGRIAMVLASRCVERGDVWVLDRGREARGRHRSEKLSLLWL